MTPDAQRFILYPHMPTIGENAIAAITEAVRWRGEGIWEVTLKPYRKNKSQEQLGYLFSTVLPAIQEYVEESTGDYYSVDNIYSFMVDKYAEHSVVTICGEPKVIRVSASKMSIKQMSEFLDKIINHAAVDMGLTIPEPKQ